MLRYNEEYIFCIYYIYFQFYWIQNSLQGNLRIEQCHSLCRECIRIQLSCILSLAIYLRWSQKNALIYLIIDPICRTCQSYKRNTQQLIPRNDVKILSDQFTYSN